MMTPSSMSHSDQIPVYRYATPYLNDVIHCVEPMSTELADRIRSLQATPPILRPGLWLMQD